MKWVSEAPVVEVSAEKFEQLARQFIRDLEKNWVLKEKRGKAPEAVAYNDSIKPWNKRVQDSINEAEVYRRPGKKFAYLLDGKAAALMLVTIGEDALKVEDLSSHPGSGGAGEIMIEKAVNVSEECGKGGRVKLYAVEDAVGFYAKLGFKTLDGNYMELRPGAANGWARLSDGKWRLKKYPSSTQFIAGVSDSSENV
jgi:hypothetical protein